jgi:hypothetical protein
MALQVTLMTEADIDGAIDTIQQAFAEDPYNKWIYDDRSKVTMPPLRRPPEILTDPAPGSSHQFGTVNP